MSHVWPCSGWGLPSRPGHPGRWCALTAPFHPRLCGPESAIGSLLSVALSFGSPRLAVSQHPALWSPDLPRHGPCSMQTRTAVTRPAHRHPQCARSGGASPSVTARSPITLWIGCRTMESGTAQLLPPERPDVLSIAALLDQVQAAITRAFPRGQLVWVRGEVQSITDRTGHCYIDLVDPDGPRGRDAKVLKVNCWARTWAPMKAALAGQGIVLEVGTVVTLRGRVEFYAPRAQVNFIAVDVDVDALLGRLAARRAALLKALETEGLLRRNSSLLVPALALRVGLVASPGTEGFNDFLGQLEGSGMAFTVVVVPAQVQGSAAPAALARGITALAKAACDVVVLVRGGG